jgi:DNA-binding beta-propeller fold protein YncE
MAPNGLRALVANYGSASVTPLTWANGTWTAGTPIAVGVNPICIAISSDGLLALVANYAAGSGTTVTPLTWANGVWTAGAPITVGTGPFSVSIAQASG